MKHILMFASAAALSFAGPALAKPGHGGGNGHGYAYGAGNGQRFGNADDDDGLDEGLARQAFGYGVGGCPPGLAKKVPACVPPGLARQQQQVLGQRALGYGVPYAAAPLPYGAYANPYAVPQVPYGYAPYGVPQVPYGPYAPYGYGAPYGYPY